MSSNQNSDVSMGYRPCLSPHCCMTSPLNTSCPFTLSLCCPQAAFSLRTRPPCPGTHSSPLASVATDEMMWHLHVAYVILPCACNLYDSAMCLRSFLDYLQQDGLRVCTLSHTKLTCAELISCLLPTPSMKSKQDSPDERPPEVLPLKKTTSMTGHPGIHR